ncbi:hypothetical protein ABT124_50200 [Streptomyces sp. NPDC001982]|uniref:hypothetical protein n=1 Tax=Streptomyces sp. NPDC001982 TaxID=3154405 RepID=UPI00332B0E78
MAAGVLLGTAATSASAATGPTEEQLLSQCAKADVCKFTATSLNQGVGPEHNVGPRIVNCGGTVQRSWSWSETIGQTTNASISATVASALWEPINVSATATFGKTFEKSHTTSETINQTMIPFTMASTTRAAGMQIIMGDWELHFPNRFFGHYIWYDKGYQSKVEDPNGGFVALHYRTMANQEINQYCPGERPPLNRATFASTRYLKGGSHQNTSLTGWNFQRDRGVHPGDGGSSSS